MPHAVDVPLLVGEGLDREGHVVGAVLRRPVGIERLHVVPFQEQRHPEAVHGRDVGQAAGGRGQEELRLVHLEGGHDGDLELHVRMGAGPLREDLAEHVRDGGAGGQVRVVLLGPHAQDEGRVGAAHAHGRDERVGVARDRGGGQGRGQGEGRDHRRPATSRYTGFVTATGAPSAAWTWTRR